MSHGKEGGEISGQGRWDVASGLGKISRGSVCVCVRVCACVCVCVRACIHV